MRLHGTDESVRVDADASLDGLIQNLTTHAGRSLGIDAEACATAQVRGLDRWLSAGSVSAARCDGTQDVHRQGPRYLAQRSGQPVVVLDTTADTRWPVWGRACQVQGYRSAAVVVGRHREVTVLLALYARRHVAWEAVTERAAGLADGLASVVTARDEVIALAHTLDDLLASSRSRPVIDRAIGVVMAQRGCDAADALAYLKAASAHGDAYEVAAALVAQAADSGLTAPGAVGRAPGVVTQGGPVLVSRTPRRTTPGAA